MFQFHLCYMVPCDRRKGTECNWVTKGHLVQMLQTNGQKSGPWVLALVLPLELHGFCIFLNKRGHCFPFDLAGN